MGHIQTFCGWAADNGLTEGNVFTGMRFRVPKKGKAERRPAFTVPELRELFLHLTDDPMGIVRNEEHRWVCLAGMFTGARLNEIAQLEVADVREVEDVPCIAITASGGDQKRLKTGNAERLVPIHDRLMACGFLDFRERQAKAGHTRLFPSYPYDKNNGYGRNAGRWFTNSFLATLQMRRRGLVFHSLRHTMNTQLAQKDVPDHLLKAILGHAQVGMSYDTYFREGFRPAQLRREINKFGF
jgi:integrase